MGYSITDWRDRYEVNESGNAARPDDALRKGALKFIRAQVHGKDWSPSYREFNRICGPDAPAVYGVFCKLRELQADNTADFRDCIRDHKGREMTGEQIAASIGWPEKTVLKCLSLLCHEDIGWVSPLASPLNQDQDQDQDQYNTRDLGKSVNSRESPGKSGKVREYTEAFNTFYDLYPRKENKPDAFKAWGQVEAEGHIDAIIAALSWQKKSDQWTKDNGKWIPMPGPYLRGRRWEDKKIEVKRTVEGVYDGDSTINF